MGQYDKLPENLRIIGACDYAVTPDGGDWTELGIGGIAPDGSLYLLDWWRGRVGSEDWVEKQIDMIPVKYDGLKREVLKQRGKVLVVDFWAGW